MKNTLLIAALSAAATAGIANAAFSDFGSNDTIGTAQDVGAFGSSFSEIGEGTIAAGDVDWFSFTLTNGALLNFDNLASADFNDMASLQLVDADGTTILASTTGSNSPLAIGAVGLAAGTYFIGVSGGEDDYATSVLDGQNFGGGDHSDAFSYKLVISASVVPVPLAALAGFGVLIPMGIKRRMSRRA